MSQTTPAGLIAPCPFSSELIGKYEALGAWGVNSLWDRFAQNSAVTPARIALVDDPRRPQFSLGPQRRVTYVQVHEEVLRLCGVLRDRGIGPGDVILTYLPNVVEQALVMLAAWRMGVVVSPMLVQFQQREVAEIVKRSGPRAVLTIDCFGKRNLCEELIQMLGTEDRLPVLYWGEKDIAGALKLAPLLAAADIDAEAALAPAVDANSMATICWTSGTEGAPKGVVRTHNNWATTGQGIVEGGGLEDGDVLLNPFPFVNMASIGGMFAPWLMTGGTFVQHIPFDLETMFHQIETEQVTYSVIAPAILRRLVGTGVLATGENAYEKLASLRALGTGSAPLEAAVFEKIRAKLGIELTNFFGSNEGLSLISGPIDCPDVEQRAVTFPRIGQPKYKWRVSNANWSRTKLTDPDSGEEIVEPGKPGLLRMKGPSIFAGYYNRGEIDRSSFDDEGFFVSGDLFEIAERDGIPDQYRFVGRHKDIVIRGGMNIAPSELDSLLSEHPKLRDVAVTGFPEPEMGERICTCAVPHTGETVTLDELNQFLLARKIAKFKLPEALLTVDEIPRSPMGKVLRQQLRETVVASRDTIWPSHTKRDEQ